MNEQLAAAAAVEAAEAAVAGVAVLVVVDWDSSIPKRHKLSSYLLDLG